MEEARGGEKWRVMGGIRWKLGMKKGREDSHVSRIIGGLSEAWGINSFFLLFRVEEL